MARTTQVHPSIAGVAEAMVLKIETEFRAILYEWNDTLAEQYGMGAIEGLFEPRWLGLWSRLRADKPLVETILTRAVVGELESCNYYWPPLMHPSVPSWEEIAERPEFGWVESESFMDALTHTFVLKYDRATLRISDEKRTVPLRKLPLSSGAYSNHDLWSETSVHQSAIPIIEKTGHIAIVLSQPPRVAPNCRLTWIQPGSKWENAFLRLWDAVRATPELLKELQIDAALSGVYDSFALDDGVFSRIAKALLPPDELVDERSEYLQFLPAIQKLPPEDQQLFQDFDAERFGAPFAEPASFVWHMLGEPTIESATLVID